jgi:membrane dipeptidase
MTTAPTAFPGLTDMHAHPAMNAYFWGRDLRKHYFAGSAFNPLASLTDFEMLREGDVRVLWSVLHVPEEEYFRLPPVRLLAYLTRGGRAILRDKAWMSTLRMLEAMEEQVDQAAEFAIAHSNAELDATLAEGKRVFVHTVEGGHQLSAGLDEGDVKGHLTRLEELASRGVASLILAHLFPNQLAGHSECIPTHNQKILFWRLNTEVDDTRGLTEVGREVVKRMAELRMVPDVTHCSPASRNEVYELVGDKIPIVASHTGVQALNKAAVNLSEEDVRAIAASGGVVGVIFMPYWLKTPDPGDGLEAIWNTMRQVNEWSGGDWQHVGIGTDFDGFTDPPDDCHSAAELPEVRKMLKGEGLSQANVDAILGGNARRVLRDGWR